MSSYTVAFVVKIQFFVFEMFIMAELAGNDTGPQFSQRAWTLLRKGAPQRSIVFLFLTCLFCTRYPGLPDDPKITRNPLRTTQHHEVQTKDDGEHLWDKRSQPLTPNNS